MVTAENRGHRSRVVAAQLEAFLRGVADGVTIQHRDGALVYANDAAAHLCGYPTAEALMAAPTSEILRRFQLFDAEGAVFPPERLPGRLVFDGQSAPEQTIRVRVCDSDVERWFSVRSTPIVRKGGAVEFAVNVFREITDLRRAERERADMQARLGHALEDMTRLHQLMARLQMRLELDQVLEEILTAVTQLQRAPMGVIRVYDPAHDDLQIAASIGFPREYLALVDRIPFDSGICGEAIARCGPVSVDDVETDPLGADRRESAGLAGYRSEHCVPLISRTQQVLGTISSCFVEPHRPSDREMHLVELYAQQASSAIDHARLYAAAQEAVTRTEHLQAMTAALLEATTAQQVAEVILKHAMAAMGAYAGTIALVTSGGDYLELLAAVNYADVSVDGFQRISSSAPFPLAHAVRSAEPVLIESRDDCAAKFPEMAIQLAGGETEALAAVPVVLDGTVVAVLGISFNLPRSYSEGDVSFLSTLSRQCAVALERARLYQAEREARGAAEAAGLRATFLSEASQLLASSLDYVTTLESVARLAVPHIGDWCTVHIVEADGNVRQLAAEHVDPEKVRWAKELQRRFPYDPAASTGVPKVLRTGEPEIFTHVTDDMLVAVAANDEDLKLFRQLGLSSSMTLPMIARGRTVGAITLVSAESGRTYGPDDLELARHLARRAAIAVDNAQLFATAERERARAAELARERDLALADTETERAHLHDLLMEAPASIAVVRGPDKVVELANRGFRRMVGDRELIGRPVRDALPELANQGFFELIDRAYETGAAISASEVPTELDGQGNGALTLGFFNTVYQPTRNARGDVEGLLVLAIDVTDEVSARRRVEQLVAEQRAILSQAAEGIAIVNPAGYFTFINEAGQRILGPNAVGAHIGSRSGAYEVLTADGAPFPEEDLPLGRALRFGKTTERVELYIRRSGRPVTIILTSSAPVTDENGNTLGAVATFRDVTIERNLEREKDDFLSAAAHDLKTPLTTIKGLAQILQRRAAQESFERDKILDGLHRIDATATRMNKLVSELLDVSHLQMSRPLDLDRSPTDLVALIGDAVSEHQGSSEKHTLKLRSDVDVLVGQWDASRLQRLVANLLSNAIKYSPHGGEILIAVALRRRDDRDYAELEVRDNGVGIPEADLPSVFRRFHRAGNVPGWVTGTGIGLAAVKQIAEQHGGAVEVDSVEGRGSTFVVSLPL